MGIYGRASRVRMRPKVRLLKAEVFETILYGCVTWGPKPPRYGRLRRVHHYLTLLRCLGLRKRKREGHTLSYARAVVTTDSESSEVTLRRRRILFARGLRGTHERRAPAEEGDVWGMVGGKGYSFGQE